MVNFYETIIIFTPVLSEEQINNTYIEYKDYLNNNNIEILKNENWGMKKLEYKINNKKNGFYYYLIYKSPSNFIIELQKKILQDERVIRFLIIKMNKHAINYLLNK
ncbi:MAG: 30S ribosomal protein S6 [Candidatus Shikimatogenerans bostrichidophilus]|nr:MAG: 30S ribosomal protein S6 [Candidatus Shikimatogenerans bostrichidophilus]